MDESGAGGDVDEQVFIHAPLSSVWQAIVDAEHRRRWWSYLQLDPVVGRRFIERWTDSDGEEVLTTGSVLELSSERLLRMSWSDESWPTQTEVVFTLTPSDGGSVVRVRHWGWGALPEGQRLAEEHRVGWRMHLSDLRDHVEKLGAAPRDDEQA